MVVFHLDLMISEVSSSLNDSAVSGVRFALVVPFLFWLSQTGSFCNQFLLLPVICLFVLPFHGMVSHSDKRFSLPALFCWDQKGISRYNLCAFGKRQLLNVLDI